MLYPVDRESDLQWIQTKNSCIFSHFEKLEPANVWIFSSADLRNQQQNVANVFIHPFF